MKIDARTRYSLMMIRKTFIKLLKENPVNKITVKKLCDEAEINRATFYRYYEDIYDLYEKTKEDFINEFFEEFKTREIFSIEEDLIHMLSLARQNADAIYALAKQSDAYEFMQTLCAKIYNKFDEIFKTMCSGLTERQRMGTYYFIVCGSTGIIAEWVERGMVNDEKEIAELLTKLITNTLKNL